MRHGRTQSRNEADHGSKTPGHPDLLNFPMRPAHAYRKTAAMRAEPPARGGIACVVKEDFVLMTASPEAAPAQNVRRTGASSARLGLAPTVTVAVADR
jgi:hypothetical protein